MFKIGQNVVYLSHGVGQIVNIITNNNEQFYVVIIDDNGAPKKVFVPVKTSRNLRFISGHDLCRDAVKIIETKLEHNIDHQTWNRRYREYMDRLHSGDLLEIAKVYRALIELQYDKELSFGERLLLQQATTLIKNEFKVAGFVYNF